MKSALAIILLAVGGAAALDFEDVISRNRLAREYFWQGVTALSEDDIALAEKNLKKAAELDPACFLAYMVLSQTEYARGNDREASAYLSKIPPEPPELAAAYEDLAADLRARNYEKVATSALSLVQAYPQTISAIAALHLLGRAWYYTDKKENALAAFKVAYMYSDLAPGTIPAYASPAEAMELETFAGRR